MMGVTEVDIMSSPRVEIISSHILDNCYYRLLQMHLLGMLFICSVAVKSADFFSFEKFIVWDHVGHNVVLVQKATRHLCNCTSLWLCDSFLHK